MGGVGVGVVAQSNFPTRDHQNIFNLILMGGGGGGGGGTPGPYGRYCHERGTQLPSLHGLLFLLAAASHRQENICYDLYYSSRGALAGTRLTCVSNVFEVRAFLCVCDRQ